MASKKHGGENGTKTKLVLYVGPLKVIHNLHMCSKLIKYGEKWLHGQDVDPLFYGQYKKMTGTSKKRERERERPIVKG